MPCQDRNILFCDQLLEYYDIHGQCLHNWGRAVGGVKTKLASLELHIHKCQFNNPAELNDAMFLSAECKLILKDASVSEMLDHR